MAKMIGVTLRYWAMFVGPVLEPVSHQGGYHASPYPTLIGW
jgi:hypothetical protein